MLAPTRRRDAQHQQHNTVGWRQLKAALFLALPRRWVGRHRAPAGTEVPLSSGSPDLDPTDIFQGETARLDPYR